MLDNFEHLLEAASEMSGLIEACPGPTVLATSRAPLHIRGEQEYPVPPLRLPASTRSPAREEVVNSPSGHLFVERALAHEDALTLTGRAKALTVIAGLVYPQGDLHRHAAFAEEGARLAREIEDREVLAMATYLGGHAAFVRGDLARAAALVGESEALYRALGDEPGTGLALALLGQIALAEGDPARAERLFDESEELLRVSGSWWNLTANLSIRAITTEVRGDHAQTIALLRESLALALRLRDTQYAAYGLEGLVR